LRAVGFSPSREAAAKSFEGMPGRRGENIRRSCEILPRFLRRLRFDAGGDPRGARLQRRENECRYRHAIRIHTRAVAGQMFKNDDGVLKVDGEGGNKKAYDPRSYLALVFQFCAGPVAVAFPSPCLRCVREGFSGPRQSLGHCVPRRDQTAQSSPIRPRRDANSNRARHHRCYSACHRVRDRR